MQITPHTRPPHTQNKKNKTKTKTKTKVHQCPAQGACGGNRTNLDACYAAASARNAGAAASSTCQCSDGYDGNLCGSCINSGGEDRSLPRYGLVQPFKCALCPKRPVLLSLLVGSSALSLVLILWTARSQMRTHAAADVLKQVIVYLQYMAIIGSTQMWWPPTLGEECLSARAFCFLCGAAESAFCSATS